MVGEGSCVAARKVGSRRPALALPLLRDELMVGRDSDHGSYRSGSPVGGNVAGISRHVYELRKHGLHQRDPCRPCAASRESNRPETAMNTGQQGPGYGPPEQETVALTQQVTVDMPRRGSYAVDKDRWERIERRVEELGRRSSFDWLAAGWAFFGAGLSAAIALLVLPHATTKGEHLAGAVRPILWTVTVGCAVLWFVFVVVHFSTGERGGFDAHDVRNELRVARGADELQRPRPWWRNLRKERRAVGEQDTIELPKPIAVARAAIVTPLTDPRSKWTRS